MMEAIINNLKTVWDLPFAREILLVGVTATLTHYLGMRKFKKERQTKYQDQIGEKIANALTEVRELVLTLRTIEIFDLDWIELNQATASMNTVYYPAFMTSMQTIHQLFDKVNEARREHEPYLDLISAAHLYVLERYLMSLMLYIGNNGLQSGTHILGLLLIVDSTKWERAFDKHLVKRINHPHYRLFSRQGYMWEQAKKYVQKKYLKDSILDRLMRGDIDNLPFDPFVECRKPVEIIEESEAVYV